MTKILLLFVVFFAIASIQAKKIRRAIIYMEVFSLVCSLIYLLYSAPDVAIAEAVIGSTLSTILLLVALKKYQIITIYYTHDEDKKIDDSYINRSRQKMINTIERFCISNELEPQVIYTNEKVDYIRKNHQYDFIIRETDKKAYIYGQRSNYLLDALRKHLKNQKNRSIGFKVYKFKDGE